MKQQMEAIEAIGEQAEAPRMALATQDRWRRAPIIIIIIINPSPVTTSDRIEGVGTAVPGNESGAVKILSS